MVVFLLLQPQLLREALHPRFSPKISLLDRIVKLQQQSAALLAFLNSSSTPSAAAGAAAAAVPAAASLQLADPQQQQQLLQLHHQQQQQQQQQQLECLSGDFLGLEYRAPTQTQQKEELSIGRMQQQDPGNPRLQKRTALRLGLMSFFEERKKEETDGNVKLSGFRV